LGLVAFNFINNFLASEKDRRKLSLIFDYLDQNRDGVLNREELLKGYA
jgi:Ca2+-binding EF-hand superfamily protein